MEQVWIWEGLPQVKDIYLAIYFALAFIVVRFVLDVVVYQVCYIFSFYFVSFVGSEQIIGIF